MPNFIPLNPPSVSPSVSVVERRIKDALGVIYTERTTITNGAVSNTEYFDVQGIQNTPTVPFTDPELNADIIPAGQSPSIAGGNALLVTIDPNSTSSIDNTPLLTEIRDNAISGVARTNVSDSNSGNSIQISNPNVQATNGVAAVMVASSAAEYGERVEEFNLVVAFQGNPVGTVVKRISRFDPNNGSNISQTWFVKATQQFLNPPTVPAQATLISSSSVAAEPNQTVATTAFTKITDGVSSQPVATLFYPGAAQGSDKALLVTFGNGSNVQTTNLTQVNGVAVSLGEKLTAASFPVTFPIDVADIRPNRTFNNRGFQQITNGSIAAEVRAVSPASTDPGLNVRQVPDNAGNTQTVGATIATSVITRLSDGVDTASIIPGGISTVGSSETALIVALSPNSADTFPNRTLGTSGLSKITDGISLAVVRAGSSQTALADAALVVSLSGNSANMSPLAPSTVATRQQIIGGQYLSTLPTLTNLQQNPALLDVNGAQVVVDKPLVFVPFGVLNGQPDTPLGTNRRLYYFMVTNNTGAQIYAQVHDSAVALAAGAIPYQGMIWRIPGNSTAVFGGDAFGSQGLKLAPNTRFAFSSTFGTYSAISMTNISAHWEVI